jgi:formate/nitrite transporter FocA (FNT family)
MLKTFTAAVLAGGAIAIGGTVFLSVENTVIGSILFTVGLFVICTRGLNLYTGKVAYALDNDKSYALGLPVIWLGNLVGSVAVGLLESLTRIYPAISARAAAVSAVKLSDSLLSLFVLAFFCNILVYVAVDGYRNNPHELGKYLALFFGVVVFILCGFEHCIADMYYFTVGGAWSARAVLCLLVITAGNTLGALFSHWISKKRK